MSPRCRNRSLSRFQSMASELNSKFESDYNDCVETLGREKRQQSSEDQMPVTDNIPRLITTPTNAAADQQEILLRTNSFYSSESSYRTSTPTLTTTQKMFLASSENGIIASPWTPSKTGLAQLSVTDTGDCESTLPTFLSVGNSFCHNIEKSTALFLMSKESVEKPPLLTRVSLEAQSRINGVKDAVHDRETKKRLHYKDKLLVLTDSLTTSSAVERSREMISNIRGVKNNSLLEKNEQKNAHGIAPEEYDSKYKKIFDGARKKLYSCSMRMCYDEAVVDHEGLIITFPDAQCFSYRGDEDSQDSGLTRNLSDISSLTGNTHPRSRYNWAKCAEREKWI